MVKFIAKELVLNNAKNPQQINNSTVCYTSSSILFQPQSLWRHALRNAINVASDGISTHTAVDSQGLKCS
jgi:hypothetical protein